MELTFPLILDGATGTQLQARGFAGGVCAERWTLEHPETILEIQRAYVEAGSKVLYAPTFGANRVKLEAHGIFNRVEEYNRRLVELSRQAADGRALVAGDLSPTGLFLYPLGDARFEELVDIYTEQAVALEKAGVDLFVIETMMSVSDARAALLAVKSVSEKPVFVTFTCNESGRTLTGSDPAAVLQILGIRGKDGEVLDQEDVRRIADSLIPVLEMAKSLPDETILPMLRTAAERCGIVLKDDQLSSLLGLFRSGSEDGGGEFSLPETIQDVQGAVSKISETASGAVRFFRTIRRTFHAMMDYFSRLGDLFH